MSVYSKDINTQKIEDRTNLKNYGFTYCLSKSSYKGMVDEAGLAQGGYFQFGNHTESAYQNLRKYVNNYLSKKTSVYKESEKSAILMHCLDMYNLKEYETLLKKQDKYLIPR